MVIASASLVRLVGEERPAIPATGWEPAFFDCGGRLCPDLPGPDHCDRYLEHLRRRIGREPGDLLAHVRRILLAHACRRNAEVEEGLSELFGILGDKGQSLRKRLLDLCGPALPAGRLQALEAAIAGQHGGERTAALPLVVRRQREEGKAPSGQQDALAEAAECLDNGQVEEALVLLEGALLERPNDAAITRALLDIYRRSRDLPRLQTMRSRLADLDEPLRQVWEEAADGIGHSA